MRWLRLDIDETMLKPAAHHVMVPMATVLEQGCADAGMLAHQVAQLAVWLLGGRSYRQEGLTAGHAELPLCL